MIRRRPCGRWLWRCCPGTSAKAGGYLPVDVLERKGRLLFQLGRFDQARKLYERVVDALRPLGETTMLGEFLYQLCGTLYSTGHYDECGSLLDQAQRMFLAAGDHGGNARVLGLRGNIAWDRGRLEEAMKLYQGKLDIARQIADTVGIVSTLGNLGGVYFTQGQHEQALRYLQEQLELATANDLQREVCIALGNLALMHSAAHAYPAAMECCQRQLALATRMGDKVGLGYAMDNMGHIRNGLGDAAGAVESFRGQLRLAEELGDRYLAYAALVNIGQVLIIHDRAAEALPPLERAIRIAVELGLSVEPKRLCLLAEARLAAGDTAGARDALAPVDETRAGELSGDMRTRFESLRQRIAGTQL